MAYNYDAYSQDRPTTTTARPSDFGDDLKIKLEPHAVIEGDLVEVFGNENHFGQSLAVKMENTVLVDGCLYEDTASGNFKVFSWKDVAGRQPDADFAPAAADANEFVTKNYFGKDHTYRLVAARRQAIETAPEIPADLREAAADGDAEAVEEIERLLEEFEPEVLHEADPAEPVVMGEGNVIMWYSGNPETGPKSASKTLAQTLTVAGKQAVIRDAEGEVNPDVTNWLADVSHDNLLREDLQGRRVALFEVRKESNRKTEEGEYRTYNHAVVVDAATGENVYPLSADEGEGDVEAVAAVTDGGSASASKARVSDLPPKSSDDTHPAIAEFVESCGILGYESGSDEGRAEMLLRELIADGGNDLTQAIVDEAGGVEAVVAAALR
jgi:hypothetical protein